MRSLLATLLVASVATPLAASPLLLDTFQDDAVGAAPNGPEWGHATYGTGLLIGVPIGQYNVVDAAGSRMLEISTTGMPGQQDNGTLVEFNPLPGAGDRFSVHYQFQLQPEGTRAGLNAWVQQIILDPLGTNLALFWPQAGLNLTLATTRPGEQGFTVQDLGVSALPGQLYTVDWSLDLAADTFSLAVDGSTVVHDQPLGADAAQLRQLVVVNNFATSGSVLMDNVRIDVASVPEPALPALLLAALPLLRRRARA